MFDNDFDLFCENFDIVDNAMQMRTLMRWNGRDLRERENLSEHTHLVVACAIKLYDLLVCKNFDLSDVVNFEELVKHCMLHDSLELLRGDILSVTKDKFKNLREQVDDEEQKFIKKIYRPCNEVTRELVELADMMACYKFIEYELRFPSNNFAINVYKSVKERFDNAYKNFLTKYNLTAEECVENKLDKRFCKGYKDDAGVDVILKEDVTFMPMSSCSIGLDVKVTPKEGEMSFLCSRTSAADKGLIVAMCPIDPNFSGEVTAIVHNVSNSIIRYDKGSSFCQVVTVPFTNSIDVDLI